MFPFNKNREDLQLEINLLLQFIAVNHTKSKWNVKHFYFCIHWCDGSCRNLSYSFIWVIFLFDAIKTLSRTSSVKCWALKIEITWTLFRKNQFQFQPGITFQLCIHCVCVFLLLLSIYASIQIHACDAAALKSCFDRVFFLLFVIRPQN